MTDKKRPEGFKGIEANLDGLLGSLGQTLGQVFSRLEALDGAEITKDFKLGTAEARASGGIRMRGARAAQTASRAAKTAPETAAELVLDLEITPTRIFVTAEVSGVSLAELTLELDGPVLSITTPTASGKVTLPDDLRADDMSSALRNGILSVEIGRGQ